MCPVEVEYAPLPLAGLDEDAAQAATLLEQRLRAKPEQAEEKRARGPQDADLGCADASDQNPCGHGCAPEEERPGHLAPLKEVGHLQSPLPDPRRQTAASRLDRATSMESRGTPLPLRRLGAGGLGDGTTVSCAITLPLVTFGGAVALQPGDQDGRFILHAS